MNGRRAKELRSLARIIQSDPPEGFITHLERYAGDFMFKAEDLHRYTPDVFKKGEDGLVTRIFKVFRSSSKPRQRDMYRWLKRLYVRGQLPDRFRMKWNVGNG